MNDLFKTYKIRFTDRTEFDTCLVLGNMAPELTDIGHSDMVFVYSGRTVRDERARQLTALGMVSFIKE